ncbi:MAG: sigma 54-interacting transcriptional regulator [Myxococcota bacterium]|nr:sigma 54-interacting transcriptional regulator [Myxococcota bacterium]
MYLRYQDPNSNAIRDFPIRKPIVSIGRTGSNDIVLSDAMIAPTHANILRKPKHLTVAVVDRGNELYVNGKRVRKADLKPGDTLLVGMFELSVHEGEPSAQASAKDLAPELQVDALARLVAFSETLMEEATTDKLFAALLKQVVELTEAEKGFVIVLQDGNRHLASSHNVNKGDLDLSRISDSIVDRVVDGRKPLIVSDAMRDQRFGKAKSVVDLQLSSVMCVPMIHRSELLGVIYLGNDSVKNLFDEGTLALLQVFAAQASLLVHTALFLNELKVSNRNLREQLRSASQGQMIGSSGSMKEIFKVMRRIAPTDLTTLILGETGTGKEMVARELHSLSDRSDGPFVSINCGAIPENLLESELFGHRKGAFTGAIAEKVGKFEAANGGTLFLDEIGEMPANLQVKLLRVLQDRKVERVGDLKPRDVDIRVVAATNQDLDKMIREGSFREDLIYRLNEVSLQLPPLRDRGDDIVQLAQFFLSHYAAQYNSKVRGFSNACTASMKGYFWPGNVRQLENRVKKAVIMSDSALLNPEDMGLKAGDKRHIKSLALAEEEFKKSYIREVLDMNNWNKAQTARDLDVDPRTIFRYIEKLED